MKPVTIILTVLVNGLCANYLAAQGTLHLSNMNQPSFGELAVGSDSWVAAPFRTGTNALGYHLNKVELLMNSPSSDPHGFSLSIYALDDSPSGSPSAPGTSLGSLAGDDPAGAGVFAYTPASPLDLSSSTGYYIVMMSATLLGQGAYNWSGAEIDPNSLNQTDGWRLFGTYSISGDGSDWGLARGLQLQFAIFATPIPEPTALALLGLAGLCLVSSALKRRATAGPARTP
jgi:hypothetical protein